MHLWSAGGHLNKKLILSKT